MIKGVLLDIAGVLHTGNALLPHAAEAVRGLREASIPLRFVTNTTRKSRRHVLEQISALSIPIEANELFTPAKAACDWLEETHYAPHLLVHPDLEEDFAPCELDGPKAVVLGDAGHGFNYDNLNAAFRLLTDGAPLLALAHNRVFQDADGKLSLDMGPFVELLEFASGAKATVLGKPAVNFFLAATHSMSVKPEETVMVGDDAESDIAGALSAGLGTAILVRTGKYREGDEGLFKPAPTEVVADIGEAADYVLSGHADD